MHAESIRAAAITTSSMNLRTSFLNPYPSIPPFSEFAPLPPPPFLGNGKNAAPSPPPTPHPFARPNR
jgi:hypothetical protein